MISDRLIRGWDPQRDWGRAKQGIYGTKKTDSKVERPTTPESPNSVAFEERLDKNPSAVCLSDYIEHYSRASEKIGQKLLEEELRRKFQNFTGKSPIEICDYLKEIAEREGGQLRTN